jgi:hypothetical protein
MVVGNGEGASTGKFVQGPKSDALKFNASICEPCNNKVTQQSDKAYDEFVLLSEKMAEGGDSPYEAFNDPRFQKNGALYIPLFRYFAKIIGCRLAELGAPIPTHLARFVGKKTSRNCIWLTSREDIAYRKHSALMEPGGWLPYAAHGGLVVITKEPKLFPSRVYTTQTVGKIQFIFYYCYTIFEILILRLKFPDFIKWCQDNALATKSEPLSAALLEKLGL